MSEFWAKTKVVLKAVPAWGAAAVAVLTTFATNVVPALPVAWQVQVGAVVASLVAGVGAVVSVVSRVTPILWPQEKGLLPADDPYEPVEGPDDWDEYVKELGL